MLIKRGNFFQFVKTLNAKILKMISESSKVSGFNAPSMILVKTNMELKSMMDANTPLTTLNVTLSTFMGAL